MISEQNIFNRCPDLLLLRGVIALLTLGAHEQRGLQYLVCVCVCLSVNHISPMERLFVLKRLSHRQQATKVEKFVGICLKRLRSRVMPRKSQYANYSDLPAVSFLRLTHITREYPNDCQQHSALPKMMPTDAASPCWRRTDSTQGVGQDHVRRHFAELALRNPYNSSFIDFVLCLSSEEEYLSFDNFCCYSNNRATV